MAASRRIAARVQRREASAAATISANRPTTFTRGSMRLQQAAGGRGTLGVERALHRGVEALDVALEKVRLGGSRSPARRRCRCSTINPAPNIAESIYPKLALRMRAGRSGRTARSKRWRAAPSLRAHARAALGRATRRPSGARGRVGVIGSHPFAPCRSGSENAQRREDQQDRERRPERTQTAGDGRPLALRAPSGRQLQRGRLFAAAARSERCRNATTPAETNASAMPAMVRWPSIIAGIATLNGYGQ